MFRCLINVARTLRPVSSLVNTPKIIAFESKGFSTLSQRLNLQPLNSLAANKRILEISQNLNPVPVRTVTKFSLKKGKRKTVKAALRRFFRLDWGAWIRPKVGRNKKMWKKSNSQKTRLKQHVFCTAAQTTMLDKMVTKFWKRPKYYVDDPYEPYHTREEFEITRRKPVVRK